MCSRNLLIALYDGKQFNRQDAISTIVKYHIDHGGVAGKSSYASVFKKATKGFSGNHYLTQDMVSGYYDIKPLQSNHMTKAK